MFTKLPRDYLKLAGSHFKYKRCNRKELQKDVDRIKKKVSKSVDEEEFEISRHLFQDWMNLLDELIAQPHQDYVNVRRGLKNCLWLQTPNICSVREDDVLLRTKENYHKNQLKK